MLANFGTKIALKRVGLPSNTFDFSGLGNAFAGDPDRQPNKLRKDPPWMKPAAEESDTSWSSWMPLTVQPWFASSTTSMPISHVPQVGDEAPKDQDKQLQLGGRKTLVVFLRCVGCACMLDLYWITHGEVD